MTGGPEKWPLGGAVTLQGSETVTQRHGPALAWRRLEAGRPYFAAANSSRPSFPM